MTAGEAEGWDEGEEGGGRGFEGDAVGETWVGLQPESTVNSSTVIVAKRIDIIARLRARPCLRLLPCFAPSPWAGSASAYVELRLVYDRFRHLDQSRKK